MNDFVARTGHGLRRPPGEAAAAGIAAALARTAPAAGVGDPALADLPLHAIAATGEAGEALAVVVSGDGGWTGFDRDVANALAARGVPVVGLDSLRYFWVPRSPDEVRRDLARILRRAFAATGKRRAILVGYSQGADVLPFMAADLDPDLRRRVALVALIGPDGRADFAVDLTGWMAGGVKAPELPVRPQIARLRGLDVLCVYGANEAHSVCPGLDRRRVARLVLPATGHFYGQHRQQIVASILDAAGRSTPRERRAKGAGGAR